MRIIDVLNSEQCKTIFSEVQNFVYLSLSEYNNAIKNRGFYCSDKDIFDFVWGTVNFSAAEICVLDSPLLQRLRRIHHLGLASSVYCNADSSRFSHTIGVTEIANRMVNVLKSRLNEKKHEIYSINEIVRLAAIFHDVGHMFYSHVSEMYFSYDESFPRHGEVTDAKIYFCEMTSSNVSLHELFSVMIVNSSETLKLIENIAPYMRESRLTDKEHYEQIVEYISCLIIGVPVDKFILPYSAIINSAIDADKLDYLSRDSACTKVPIAVDIARIAQKLDVVSVPNIEYPKIWNDISSEATPLRIMAIKDSAKKVFWQLSNARSNMYESVYHHHKVLTAETMFRQALQKIYLIEDEENIKFDRILTFTDDVFGEYWNLIFFKSDQSYSKKVQEISQIFKNIRERNLYKRVAAFSRDSVEGSLYHVKKFFDKIIQNSFSDEHKKFMCLLKDEYKKICHLLNKAEMFDTSLEFMFIYSKYDAMSSIPIGCGEGYDCIWSSELMKQETMEAGKKSKQEQFYLLTNCQERPLIYLALEKTLVNFEIYKLHENAAICSKISREKMNNLRRKLFEAGYYKDTLYILNDDIFIKLMDAKLVSDVLSKFRSFSGTDSCQVNMNTLTKFLRQFLWINLDKSELELILDGVLRLLNEAYYLDRDAFSSQAIELLKRLSTHNEKKHIVNLGGLFDSSKHLMYYFNDVRYDDVEGLKKITFEGSLETALDNVDENNCLCFFDDAAYSGKQVISIFQELMGVSVDKRTTNEHHVSELSDANKKKLQNTKIVLSYLCFNSQSTEYIQSELNKLGLKNIMIEFVNDLSLKIFSDENAIFANNRQKELVKNCLADIGKSILLSSKKLDTGEFKKNWNEERVKNAALGYNDAQQLVVFSTNIPTYSITAFWGRGEYNGRMWEGLFKRTEKN